MIRPESDSQTLALIVLGASAGGLQAFKQLLSRLGSDFPLPIVLIQHRAQESRELCQVLQSSTELRVREVLDKQPLEPGAFVAPAGYHLLIERGYFALSTDDRVQYSRPSIDVGMSSAAISYGSAVTGIVLTGANGDGARGLHAIWKQGGGAIVQDPATADCRTMPEAALELTPASLRMNLHELGDWLAHRAIGATRRRSLSTTGPVSGSVDREDGD